MKFMHGITLLLSAVLTVYTATAGAKEKYVFGWVEKIHVMDVGATAKAKMDSGALTSSIHATNVERYRLDGKKWVRFTVTLQDTETGKYVTKTLERPFVRAIRVSGAGGSDSRVVVSLPVCVGSTIMDEEFSLNNRADMIYGLLIGRRTMEHMGLLDVNKTFTLKPTCTADNKTGKTKK